MPRKLAALAAMAGCDRPGGGRQIETHTATEAATLQPSTGWIGFRRRTGGRVIVAGLCPEDMGDKPEGWRVIKRPKGDGDPILALWLPEEARAAAPAKSAPRPVGDGKPAQPFVPHQPKPRQRHRGRRPVVPRPGPALPAMAGTGFLERPLGHEGHRAAKARPGTGLRIRACQTPPPEWPQVRGHPLR